MGGPIPRKGVHTVSASGYVPWGSKSASGYGPRGVKIRCDTGLNQIEALKSGGFSWSEIARTLGISDKTLHRRRHKLGMRVEGREYSNLSDHDLDNSIRNIVATAPGAGFRLVQGGFRESYYRSEELFGELTMSHV